MQSNREAVVDEFDASAPVYPEATVLLAISEEVYGWGCVNIYKVHSE